MNMKEGRKNRAKSMEKEEENRKANGERKKKMAMKAA